MPHKDPEVRKAYDRAYALDPIRHEKILETKRQRRTNGLVRDTRKRIPSESRRRASRKHAATHPEYVKERAAIKRALKRKALIIRFSQAQWLQKVSYWGNRCWICHGPWTQKDHVLPLATGGAHCLANLRPACQKCNSSKGARSLDRINVRV